MTPSKNSGSEIGSVEVGAEQVGAQALRRLVGHLDAVLQDRDAGTRRRARGEPQAEVAVEPLAAKSSQIFSSVGIHETDRWQFCKHDPRAVEERVRDELLRDGPLALAERDRVGLLAAKPIASANLSSSDIGSCPG